MTRAYARAARSYSLRRSLALLVLTSVMPVVLVAVLLVYDNYQLQRANFVESTRTQAAQIAAGIDRELAGIESGLKVLAITPELVEGRLGAFQALAARAVEKQSIYNYVVLDRDGRQVLNTLAPIGAELPRHGNPARLQRIFETGEMVLSDYFIGPVTGRPAVAMGVPVVQESEVRFSLNVGLSPRRIESLLDDNMLPDGWVSAVVDGSGTVVASNTADVLAAGDALPGDLAERIGAAGRGVEDVTLSQLALPELGEAFVALAPVGAQPWSVLVIAPRAGLSQPLRFQVSWLGVTALIALAISGWIAVRLVGRVIGFVKGLDSAARAIGTGREVALPRISFTEAEAVGEAIVEASRTTEQLQYMAQHDALTGLANRWLFEELLRHQIAVAARRQGRLALMVVDLDGFKAVNDQYGHAEGDRVLREAARRIEAELRTADVVARMGGDEFAVLVSDADAAQAGVSARRLLTRLAEPYEGVACAVSASIGVAAYRGECDTADVLFRRADQRMYEAKKAGKNRVVSSG